MIHVLRVDEDLEGAALLVRGAGVEHDVVDGHVKRMLEQRALDLVGRAQQHFWPLQALVHLDDFAPGGRRSVACPRLIAGRFDDFITHDLLVDADRHVQNFP